MTGDGGMGAEQIAKLVAGQMDIGDGWTVGDVADTDDAYRIVAEMDRARVFRRLHPLVSTVRLVRQSNVVNIRDDGTARLIITMNSGLKVASDSLDNRAFSKFQPDPAIGLTALEDAVGLVLWIVRRLVDQYELLTEAGSHER